MCNDSLIEWWDTTKMQPKYRERTTRDQMKDEERKKNTRKYNTQQNSDLKNESTHERIVWKRREEEKEGKEKKILKKREKKKHSKCWKSLEATLMLTIQLWICTSNIKSERNETKRKTRTKRTSFMHHSETESTQKNDILLKQRWKNVPFFVECLAKTNNLENSNFCICVLWSGCWLCYRSLRSVWFR